MRLPSECSGECQDAFKTFKRASKGLSGSGWKDAVSHSSALCFADHHCLHPCCFLFLSTLLCRLSSSQIPLPQEPLKGYNANLDDSMYDEWAAFC